MHIKIDVVYLAKRECRYEKTHALRDFTLIRTDGTVLGAEEMHEIGFGGIFVWSVDKSETKFTGNWGRVPAFALIDLDEYCGLQINGTNYYYAAE